jgi:hypothetical protein
MIASERKRRKELKECSSDSDVYITPSCSEDTSYDIDRRGLCRSEKTRRKLKRSRAKMKNQKKDKEKEGK